jgi:molybdate transport system ATP-binding protein
MSLEARVAIADRGLDASLTVQSGRTLALLGPNASGKSSLLAALAGLVRPDEGYARIGDTVVFDLPASTTGARAPSRIATTWTPAHERPVGLLGQTPLLFPHLSSLDNVAFPARSRGERAADARAGARTWLESVDAAQVASSRPGRLSGGQAQRVAIARALAAEPSVLLLDEPLAALDIDAAMTVRALLAAVLAARTAVFATHDVIDAAMLADDIAVMHRGRIVESGAAADVLARPRQEFTARMAGRGLLRGSRTATGIELADGTQVRAALSDDAPVGSAALLSCPPRAVRVMKRDLSSDASAMGSVMSATISAVESRHESLRVWAGGLIVDVSVDEAQVLAPRAGDHVTLCVDPAGAVVYRDASPAGR